MMQPGEKAFRDLIGVPFMSGGRDPALGLDCWGLFMLAMGKFGILVPDVDVLCTELVDINRTARRQIDAMWQQVAAPEPGAAVVMSTDHNHPGLIQHFGVMIDRRQVIHCLRETGVVADRLDVMQGALCVYGFYRWRGLDG